MSRVLERLGELALVPVVKIEDAEDAPRLGKALMDGGLPCAEITFRTEAAEEAIRSITSTLPEIVAALGGIAALEAIADPYSGVKFIPTGGIDATNPADYLALRMVHACGGSWMVKPSLIAGGNFSEIARLTQEAVAIVRGQRGKR